MNLSVLDHDPHEISRQNSVDISESMMARALMNAPRERSLDAPDWHEGEPAFEERTQPEKLDAIERACRNEFYKESVAESLTQSDESARFLQALMSREFTDAQVGALARRLMLDYVQACATKRGDDLRTFL